MYLDLLHFSKVPIPIPLSRTLNIPSPEAELHFPSLTSSFYPFSANIPLLTTNFCFHYTNCSEENLKHLEGKDYELADFVITNPDGSYKIAFDVKNMRPDADHNDKIGDMPTSKKRQIKRERLGCELITVNILLLPSSGMDDIREIGGIIDYDGNVIFSAIERLQNFINAK